MDDINENKIYKDMKIMRDQLTDSVRRVDEMQTNKSADLSQAVDDIVISILED